MKRILMAVALLGITGAAIPAMGLTLNNPSWVSYWALVDQRTGYIAFPGEKDIFTVTLRGGVSYKITLTPPSYADFDLYVFDENGNLVGHSELGRGSIDTVYITPAGLAHSTW